MNSKNVVARFRQAELVKRVASRFAMEHSSPEELRDYLHEHPNADPKNHHVEKKDSKPTSSAGLESDYARSQTRSKATTKAYEDMKSLKKKVDNAEPSAKKRFDAAYNKIFEGGQAAVKHADKLLKKVSPKAGTEAADAKKLLAKAVDDWEGNKTYHLKAKDDMAHTKLSQAESSEAYATMIETQIEMLHKALKGDYD